MLICFESFGNCLLVVSWWFIFLVVFFRLLGVISEFIEFVFIVMDMIKVDFWFNCVLNL